MYMETESFGMETPTDIDIVAPIDENKETPAFIPDSMRRKHENPLNLTQEQLDLKNEEISRLKTLYPDVDSYWADIILDICLTKSQAEIDEIKARVGPFKRDYSNLQNELDKVKEGWGKDMAKEMVTVP